MNCPTCNAKGRIWDSRPVGDTTVRRYRCPEDDTHPKWLTVEQIDLVYTPEYTKQQRAARARSMGQMNIGRGRQRKKEKS